MDRKRGVGRPSGKLARAARFLAEDVWDLELSSLSSLPRLGARLARILHLVVKRFREDQCPLHASALTYMTLMSLVPVLAVSFAAARGFGAGDAVERQIRTAAHRFLLTTPAAAHGPAAEVGTQGASNVVSAPIAPSAVPAGLTQESVDEIVTRVLEWVNNINFKALGGIGIALLFLTVLSVLSRIESSFNRVWGVTTPRPVHRRLFDYVAMLVILPILAIAASSLPVAGLVTRIAGEGSLAILGQFMSELLGSSLFRRGGVLLFTTIAFTFLIMFVPNTKVRVRPGLAGGLMAAISFLVWMGFCAWLQIGVMNNLKIYAGFAMVPIILFWVYVSWEILLFGAEVAFAVQNHTTYRMESGARFASARSRALLTLSVLGEAARSLNSGSQLFEISSFARDKKVSVRLLHDVVTDLVDAGLLGEISGQPESYALLRRPEALRVVDAVSLVFDVGGGPREFGLDKLGPEIHGALQAAEKGMDKGLESLTVKDLIAG